MMARAEHLQVPGEAECVYLVADAHLGDSRAPVEGFVAMLEQLPERGLVVFMGDLCKVWLALPKFWDGQVRRLLEGFAALRARGLAVWFVVGNREYFLPRNAGAAQARGLPFDAVIHEAAVMHWAGRRYGLTHGDLVNRADRQYLKWRYWSRSRPFEALFRALPGPLARHIAAGLEKSLANTNQEIKISYPLEELQAFTAAAMDGLDGYFIGHFHREETISMPEGGAELRIVPDWFSTRRVLRLDTGGRLTALEFPD